MDVRFIFAQVFQHYSILKPSFLSLEGPQVDLLSTVGGHNFAVYIVHVLLIGLRLEPMPEALRAFLVVPPPSQPGLPALPIHTLNKQEYPGPVYCKGSGELRSKAFRMQFNPTPTNFFHC